MELGGVSSPPRILPLSTTKASLCCPELLALSLFMKLCCHSNPQGHIPEVLAPEWKYSQEERATAAAFAAPLFTSPASDTPSSPSDDLTLPLKRQDVECRPHHLTLSFEKGSETRVDLAQVTDSLHGKAAVGTQMS